MEIDITDYVENTEHGDISASTAELGPDAGKITWANAQREAKAAPFLATTEDCDEARDWLKGFGAWSDEELAADSDDDIRALIMQFISGDIRAAERLAPGDGPGCIDWAEYERLSAEGTVSGSAFLGTDGRVYFYIGE